MYEIIARHFISAINWDGVEGKEMGRERGTEGGKNGGLCLETVWTGGQQMPLCWLKSQSSYFNFTSINVNY